MGIRRLFKMINSKIHRDNSENKVESRENVDDEIVNVEVTTTNTVETKDFRLARDSFKASTSTLGARSTSQRLDKLVLLNI